MANWLELSGNDRVEILDAIKDIDIDLTGAVDTIFEWFPNLEVELSPELRESIDDEVNTIVEDSKEQICSAVIDALDRAGWEIKRK